MNTAQILITDCLKCPYISHNGLLQARPKFVCDKSQDRRVLANITKKSIPVPDWCPLITKDN